MWLCFLVFGGGFDWGRVDWGMLGNKGLRRGMVFSSTNLDNERKRISNILADSGYYKFNKDFIHYEADSVGKPGCVDLVLRLIKYRASNNSPEINHVKYYINDIRYHSNDGGSIPIRRKVLANNTAMKSGEPFGAATSKCPSYVMVAPTSV